MRQAYDYWQDQPGFYQRASPERKPKLSNRVRLGVRELRRNRELTDTDPCGPASQLWSRPLFTRRNGTSGRTHEMSPAEAPPPSEHGSKRTHALRRRYQWGCPSGYAYVFPPGGPRRTNADDGHGSNAKDPSEQPSTSAPELLPDREANVNVIAEGKALGP